MVMALEDIRIIDLTWQGPGPYCTMMLADQGAQVIRVQEPTLSGRRAASAASPEVLSLRDDPKKAGYNIVGRNKRSITLNLKHDAARDAFYKLARRSDVVVEGYRPGVASRLKIDYPTLRDINPRLVYCAISGYGQDGPYVQLTGHDINYIGFAGALGLIGDRGGPPAIPSNMVGDYGAGGMQAAFGILVALHARERTGRGQYVDISMTDGVFSLLAQETSFYLGTGVAPRRGEALLNGGVPYYNVYQTKDGKYLAVGCLESWFYENLCRALGLPDLIPHQNATGEKREETFRAFRDVFKTRTRDEWFHYLKDKDVCVGKVYDFEEAFNDPQLRHRDMVIEVPHPTEGKITQPGISVKLSETPGAVRQIAAPKGEHTRAVLEELGYSAQTIEELEASGAI